MRMRLFKERDAGQGQGYPRPSFRGDRRGKCASPRAASGGWKGSTPTSSTTSWFIVLHILGIGIVIYAFSFEVLGFLFSSQYFNNLVRFSFALLLVALVVYLVTRERKYTQDFDGMVDEL